MQYRTDLALEMLSEEDSKGVEHTTEEIENITIDRVRVIDSQGEKITGKPVGSYITVSVPAFSDSLYFEKERELIASEIRKMLPQNGPVLVVGLGNTSITPDALGPLAVKGILATRHISGEFERIAGLSKLRSVAVLAPGVLGQTGIEVSEIILSVCRRIKPSAVIAIDALASLSLSRLGCTVQICDTGISPGAGVGNNRAGINKETVGIPVIAVGVPTVVDAATLVLEAAIRSGASHETALELEKNTSPSGERMIVTPHEIDLLINRAAKLIALSVNLAMHPDYDPEDLANAV